MRKVIQYLSKKGSSRFLALQKEILFTEDVQTENEVLNLYPEIQYQSVLGFGGAFTEAAAVSYSKLSPAKRKKVVEALFSPNKAGFNFCRTHIQSADFGLSEYAYVEDGDTELKTFSIDRDFATIIPFIKDAKEVAGDELNLFASPWSPPGFMKENKERKHGGKLAREHYATWANLIVKYLQAYEKEGIPFFAMTVQNEAKAWQTWESCEYTAKEEGEFLAEYLRPALDKAGFKDLKVMIWDHNKERAYDRARDSFTVKGAKDATWGIAIHFYSGTHYANLDLTHEAFPDKPILLTEFAFGQSVQTTTPVPHSGWEEVELASLEMIHDFNHHISAATDWNLLLDETGGPFHNRDGGCKAGIIVDSAKKTFTLEPLYYSMRHFSGYVKRDAVRIGVSSFSDTIVATAFKNPDGSLAVILLNTSEKKQTTYIRLEDETAKLVFPPKSLSTLIIE